MSNAYKFCFVRKRWTTGRKHKNKNGRPACGARVDTCALEYFDVLPFCPGGPRSEWDLEAFGLCKRCFKNDLPVLDRLAAI